MEILVLAQKGWMALVDGVKAATGVDLTAPLQAIGGKECSWCVVGDSYIQFAGHLISDGIELADSFEKADAVEWIEGATTTIFKTCYDLYINVTADRRISNAYEELDAYTDAGEKETDLKKVEAKYATKIKFIKKDHEDRNVKDESMAKFQEKMQNTNMAKACICVHLKK